MVPNRAGEGCIPEILRNLNSLIHELPDRIQSKPLIGGPFGASGYVLASMGFTLSGLHCVTYIVFEERHWVAIGAAHTKAEALQQGRAFIRHLGPHRVAELAAQIAAERVASAVVEKAARAEEAAAPQAEPRKKNAVPRRRRALFEKFGGQCYYCACHLELADKWHIEHKLPKALGGTNDPENLVVACAPCNLRKRDRTDTEFEAIERPALKVAA